MVGTVPNRLRAPGEQLLIRLTFVNELKDQDSKLKTSVPSSQWSQKAYLSACVRISVLQEDVQHIFEYMQPDS